MVGGGGRDSSSFSAFVGYPLFFFFFPFFFGDAR